MVHACALTLRPLCIAPLQVKDDKIQFLHAWGLFEKQREAQQHIRGGSLYKALWKTTPPTKVHRYRGGGEGLRREHEEEGAGPGIGLDAADQLTDRYPPFVTVSDEGVTVTDAGDQLTDRSPPFVTVTDEGRPAGSPPRGR